MRVIRKRKNERIVACTGTHWKKGCGELLAFKPEDIIQRDDRSSDYVESWIHLIACPKCGVETKLD